MGLIPYKLLLTSETHWNHPKQLSLALHPVAHFYTENTGGTFFRLPLTKDTHRHVRDDQKQEGRETQASPDVV